MNCLLTSSTSCGFRSRLDAHAMKMVVEEQPTVAFTEAWNVCAGEWLSEPAPAASDPKQITATSLLPNRCTLVSGYRSTRIRDRLGVLVNAEAYAPYPIDRRKVFTASRFFQCMVSAVDQPPIRVARGETARDLVIELARNSSAITAFFVTSYEPTPTLEERTVDRRATALFISEALRHHGFPEPPLEVRSQDVPDALAGDPPSGRVRAFCSRVRCRDGEYRHLPLLDFRHPVSDEASDAFATAMRRLGESDGALLASTHSYHYYGLVPRDLDGWRRFMSHALLLSPLVDARFVGHCLIDDLACLRLDRFSTHPSEPVVVRRLQ